MNIKNRLVLIIISILTLSCQSRICLYVDSSGTNPKEADGTKEKPFSSFWAAYQATESIKNHSGKAVELIFREGTYSFKNGYLINRFMSNLIIKAYPGENVVFSGAKSIPLNLLSTDSINGMSVLTIDLNKAGITNYGKIKNTGFSRPLLPSWGELFVNGKALHLSRWPNNGMIRMGKIIDEGSIPRYNDFSDRGAVMQYDSARISLWEPTEDMWIGGYFRHGYADDVLRIAELNKEKKTITTDGATLYGFYSGHDWNRWYAFNIKEELDEAGEYYLDRSNGKLYFISPETQISSLNFSVLEEPFFDIFQAKDIKIKDITFEFSRTTLLSLVGTENVSIQNCIFRNSGSIGLMIGKGTTPFEKFQHEGTGNPIRGNVGSLPQHLYSETTFNRDGGKNNRIDYCQFYDLGAGGVSMGGGDRLTLTPGNNIISNCLFYNNNRIDRSYRPEVHITGVGNIIKHCEMFGSPSMAILMHGNNHLVEYNYIHDVCKEADDQGAFYYGRNPSECGSIIRHNLFANISDKYATCAIYHDDGAGGLTVENNIFYKTGKYSALIGGGSDNRYSGNLFINGSMGIHIDNRLQNWGSDLIKPNGLFELRLNAVNYLAEPYASAYPYLKNYIPNDSVPSRNTVQNNTFIGIKTLSDNPRFLDLQGNKEFRDSFIYQNSPSRSEKSQEKAIQLDPKKLGKQLKEKGFINDKYYNKIGIIINANK